MHAEHADAFARFQALAQFARFRDPRNVVVMVPAALTVARSTLPSSQTVLPWFARGSLRRHSEPGLPATQALI